LSTLSGFVTTLPGFATTLFGFVTVLSGFATTLNINLVHKYCLPVVDDNGEIVKKPHFEEYVKQDEIRQSRRVRYFGFGCHYTTTNYR
jgi:hypothetical protein